MTDPMDDPETIARTEQKIMSMGTDQMKAFALSIAEAFPGLDDEERAAWLADIDAVPDTYWAPDSLLHSFKVLQDSGWNMALAVRALAREQEENHD
jgi:hypothetical protein